MRWMQRECYMGRTEFFAYLYAFEDKEAGQQLSLPL